MNVQNSNTINLDYFAYGSNMSTAQILERCPSAVFIGVAHLKGFQIHFPRLSKTRNCGAASIIQSDEDEVWGVIFRITNEDIINLDKLEGINSKSYRKEEITVHNISNKQSHSVFTYIANPQPGSFKPSKDYLATILRGLNERIEIPESYKNLIKSLEVMD